MKCWFWNIDINDQHYMTKELFAGRLRQGWGYSEELDLRRLIEMSDDECNEEEMAAWTRCAPMIESIDVGDIVAVKNIPRSDSFTLVRVTGPYTFSLDRIGDFGHILPVEVIRVFNKNSALVPTTLANALNREQHAIRVTYKHHATLQKLAVLPESELKESEKPQRFKEKVMRWRIALIPHLRKILEDSLSPREAERLVLELLRHDDLEVVWNAGAGEKGADLLSTIQIGYGLDTQLAIQVKMHRGIDDDMVGLDQIEQAFKEHRVHAGLLVSMAEDLGDRVKERVKQLQSRYKVEVLYGEDLYLRLLNLIADPEHELEGD